MRTIVLASGSNGNSTYIESGNVHILVDCGLTYKLLNERLNEFDLDLSIIDALLITHEHGDHTKGIRVLLARHPNIQVYMTEGTKKGLPSEVYGEIRDKHINIVKGFDEITFDSLNVKVLPLHHDALETIGFIFREQDKKLVYITDTGYVDQKYYEETRNAEMYIIESNYDPDLLYSSARPFELKQRIAGDSGHLSNEDSAIFLVQNIGKKTKEVVYAHISNDCNYYSLSDIIRKIHQDVYKDCNIDVSNVHFSIGSRTGVTGEFNI